MTISLEKLDEIRNQSILENSIDVYFYWEYKHCRKFFYEKRIYVHNRNEFIRKMKIKYPFITADEICNSIKIYLRHDSTENRYYFLHEKQIWIRNFGFLGPYLKEKETLNIFGWMNITVLVCIFPDFSFSKKKMSAVSKELPYEDHSLFEFAIDVFYLSQYRKLDGFFDQKSKYIFCRDEFIRKFRIKYPQMSDEKIFNFMSIYLL